MKRLIASGLMSLACIPAWTAESNTVGSVNGVAALHAKVITPASNALFQAESTPPSTAHEWQIVRASAGDLEQAAMRLTTKDLAKTRASGSNSRMRSGSARSRPPSPRKRRIRTLS